MINHNQETKLPGDYVAGFIDGEGCFCLAYRSEKKYSRRGQPKYFRWLPYFAMTLREDDIEILQKIRNTLDCGNIYYLNKKDGGKQAYYGIQNIDDLHNKVIPFFKKYRLRAKKRLDFELWCEALQILFRNKRNNIRCSDSDNKILMEIRQNMRKYKSRMNRGYRNNPDV